MTDESYQYQHLLNEMDKISKLHEQEWRKSGKYFNVFSALGVEKKEIRHSALLATFLNPNAIHGMSDIFLKEFMKRIGFNDFPTKEAIVYTEEVISNYRRLDIDICSADGKYKVVIENKIGITDHDNQLNAYFEDLRNQNLKNYKLIYLTLNGDEPVENISEKDKSHLICMSYKDDVIQIIDVISSIENMLPQPVLEILRQYSLTLKNLTNQGVDKIMNEEITKLLLTGNNLELAENLAKEIDPMKIDVMGKFLSLLKHCFEENKRKTTIVYKTETRLENAVSRYVTTKSNSDTEWLIFGIESKGKDVRIRIVFDPDGCYWIEAENYENFTEEFNKITNVTFDPIKMCFKNPDEGFKKFALMPDEDKKAYVSKYVKDIVCRLKEMEL